MVATVPAHLWLWNAHDVDVGHKRRYTKKTLKALLERNNFEVLYISYFFSIITPLLLLRTFINPAKKNQIPKGDTIPTTNKLFNKILIWVLRFENKYLSFLQKFFGGSLFVIGKNKY